MEALLMLIIVLILFFVIGGWIVMATWNYVLPNVANVGPLNMWQAMALLILCALLFGGGSHIGNGFAFYNSNITYCQ